MVILLLEAATLLVAGGLIFWAIYEIRASKRRAGEVDIQSREVAIVKRHIYEYAVAQAQAGQWLGGQTKGSADSPVWAREQEDQIKAWADARFVKRTVGAQELPGSISANEAFIGTTRARRRVAKRASEFNQPTQAGGLFTGSVQQ